MSLRYASACSGIEAATVAWHPLGWEPAWFSEIEAFPCAVLKHHYPAVPNLGDMTNITEADIARHGRFDVFVAGTPCQSFSVAGLRKGMADPRGNLALVFLRLVDWARPTWVVWENVPGVLSSSGGRDFGSFLGALGQLGYGFAYRVLDAQYLGVPQRRRRVFVVGHLGDWRRAAAVLFERHSLSGNPPPRRQAGPGTARDVAASLRSGGAGTSRVGDTRGQDNVVAVSRERERELHQHSTPPTQRSGDSTTNTSMAGLDFSPSISRCLNAGAMGRLDFETETLIPVTGGFFDGPAHSLRADGFDASEDGTGRGTPIIPIDMRQASRGEKMTNNRREGSSGGAPGTGIGEPGDPCPSLSISHTPAIAFDSKGTDPQPATVSPTLRSMNHSTSHANAGGQVAVAYRTAGDGEVYEEGDNTAPLTTATDLSSNVVALQMNFIRETRIGDYAGSIQANPGNSQFNGVWDRRMGVRRLTPRECERLQGFPDDYSLVPHRNKPAADGPRYKALGNSMATPVMRWIGERIELVHNLETLTPSLKRAKEKT